MNGELGCAVGTLFIIRALQARFCFERIRMIFYTIWTTMAYYAVYEACSGRGDFIHWVSSKQITSINTVYCYELLFHTPDFGHTTHHIATIFLQCFAHYGGFASRTVQNSILCTSSHIGMFSSILSSVRIIAKTENSPNQRLVSTIYFYSYLVAKPGMTVAHYTYWYVNRDIISFQGYKYVHAMYAIVHLIQLYFSFKIIKVLQHQRAKRH